MGLKEDATKALGQLFLTGFNGLELSDETSSFLSQANIGGVLLFTRNFDNLEQLIELNLQIQTASRDKKPWIAVDYEGGRVQRFKQPFTIIPAARTLGDLRSPKYTFDVAEIAAKELYAVGVNLNFTPVCDIQTNPKNPVIGDRAYGDTEDVVSKMSSATIRGHLVQQVQPCAKHFPGHGDTNLDSHFDLPKVDTPLKTLMAREFRPFSKAFRSHCNFTMTAHVLNPNLDPNYPATLSKPTLDILRKNLRFEKIIISDDLEMKSITDHFGEADAPKLALEAGCDMLIYRSETGCRKAYESLTKALQTGKLDPNIVLASVERIQQVKNNALQTLQIMDIQYAKKIVGCAEHQSLISTKIGK